jgi:hypothetical protein
MSFFFKVKNRKVKTGLSEGWYHWEGEGYKEMV